METTWQVTLREKCPNTEFFLVRIFPHLDWIRRRSISPYSVRMRENADQKKLGIWTLFMQYQFHQIDLSETFISLYFVWALPLCWARFFLVFIIEYAHMWPILFVGYNAFTNWMNLAVHVWISSQFMRLNEITLPVISPWSMFYHHLVL